MNPRPFRLSWNIILTIMQISQFLGRWCTYDHVYITTGKFIFFRELYRLFSPFFILPANSEDPGEKGEKLGEQIRSRRALIKMDPVRQLGFLLHSLSGTIFSVHAYIIVTAKYTIKNLTSSKIDNLLISLRVSASSGSSSSSFRSENSTVPPMLS